MRVIELRVHARRLTKLLSPTVLSTSLLSANCRLSPGKTSFQRKQSFRQFTNFPTRTLDFSLYFSGSCISTNESFVIIETTYTAGKDSFQRKVRQNVRNSSKCPFDKMSVCKMSFRQSVDFRRSVFRPDQCFRLQFRQSACMSFGIRQNVWSTLICTQLLVRRKTTREPSLILEHVSHPTPNAVNKLQLLIFRSYVL